MNRKDKYFLAIFAALLVTCLISSGVYAQEGVEDAKAKMKGDKTGANPINFTFDARLYNDFQWLNTAGDGTKNVTTFEFRAPFADNRWQFRTRIPYSVINADLNDDGVDDWDESGLGDIDFRFLTVPYLNMQKRLAIAVGLETFLNTASEDELGRGATYFGPQAFFVYFAPFGLKGTMLAPGYQYRFSVDEDDGRDDINESAIDLYYVWISPDKQNWALLDPQIILDHENSTEYMVVDLEMGQMLDKFFGTKGHSAYLRPAVGVGSDRPLDGAIEIGYKIVW